jgi:hypothetical protein
MIYILFFACASPTGQIGVESPQLGRTPAILVLLGFSVSLVSPILFSDSESKLPGCCRRDGSHHCSMMNAADRQLQESGLNFKRTRTKCPLYPTGAMPTTGKATAPRPMSVAVASSWRRQTAVEQKEALFRLSFSRASQKRGPPPVFS